MLLYSILTNKWIACFKFVFFMKPILGRLISKNIPVNIKRNKLSACSFEELMELHSEGEKLYDEILFNSKYWNIKSKPAVSWLDIKIELTKKLMSKCTLCVHECGVNRMKNEKGLCMVGKNSYISSEYIHLGEEKEISPAHTIFFTGCTFRCIYCQNWKGALREGNESYYSPAILKEIITERFKSGAKTVEFVGGTPEPHLLTILKIAKILPHDITPPFVFNSNASLSAIGLRLTKGVIDIYLPDFKYGNNQCAFKYSGIKDYMETVRENVLFMTQTAPVIVRHLVLPNHIECCTYPVIEWVRKNAPEAKLNVMFQYRPCYKANEIAEISRTLNKDEISKVETILSEEHP